MFTCMALARRTAENVLGERLPDRTATSPPSTSTDADVDVDLAVAAGTDVTTQPISV